MDISHENHNNVLIDLFSRTFLSSNAFVFFIISDSRRGERHMEKHLSTMFAEEEEMARNAGKKNERKRIFSYTHK